MKNNKSKLKTGFTLIETLVAVTILSVAMAGPMTLSIKSIGTASVSQDQLTAFYLGQEVIEYIRNTRDTNFIKDAGWLDGLTFCEEMNGCYIDVVNDEVSSCGTSCDNKLKFDDINLNYNYANGKETAFDRTVKIENPVGSNSDEAKISVSVKWTGKYGEKTMNLQDNIFNWRQE